MASLGTEETNKIYTKVQAIRKARNDLKVEVSFLSDILLNNQREQNGLTHGSDFIISNESCIKYLKQQGYKEEALSPENIQKTYDTIQRDYDLLITASNPIHSPAAPDAIDVTLHRSDHLLCSLSTNAYEIKMKPDDALLHVLAILCRLYNITQKDLQPENPYLVLAQGVVSGQRRADMAHLKDKIAQYPIANFHAFFNKMITPKHELTATAAASAGARPPSPPLRGIEPDMDCSGTTPRGTQAATSHSASIARPARPHAVAVPHRRGESGITMSDDTRASWQSHHQREKKVRSPYPI